ncbi:hypothetical protein BFP72_00585 [Reichenbachiella sp. 5M10]|uniref:hypothetical protein n=1 Tax=Reichenbachiella sp. 5M10 TaxID=1889772 RepID=UPI000C14CB87|nr:hypothetical protein [Reichenbachiella sp. 5M10]PIB34030.1 hypothetical protein BFP72_00585 [Reichenbachiella sp. 5M10]
MKMRRSIVLLNNDPVMYMIANLLINHWLKESTIQVLSNEHLALHFIVTQTKVTEEITVLLDLDIQGFDGGTFIQAFDKLSDSVKEKVQIFVIGSNFRPLDEIRIFQSKAVKNHFEKALLLEKLQRMEKS